MNPLKKPFVDAVALREYLEKAGLDTDADLATAEIVRVLETAVADRIKSAKNAKRIRANDEAKQHIPALEKLTEEQVESLPKWVRDVVEQAVVIGKSEQVIQVPDGKKYHLRNRLNDLPGGAWTYFLNSVVSTRFPTNGPESYAHEIRKIHPSPKPPQLMQQIIEFFTKEGELVLDYFSGVGGTLIGASLCNRRAIGIDLSQKYLDAYNLASETLGLEPQLTIQADSIEALKPGNILDEILVGEACSLILIDPPYGDMMSRPKTGQAVKSGADTSPTPFTELDNDLGNMGFAEFLSTFTRMVEDSLRVLKPKGHVVVFIKDLQPDDLGPNLLHADLIYALNDIPGLKYLGTKIWADQGVNLYPYGYPFSFVANQIHQYIMIFRKE